MRRSILALACVGLTCAALGAPAPSKRDSTLLVTTWSEQVDPDKDCKFVKDGDALVIEIPGKDHDLWPRDRQMNAPRLLKEVEGDFDVQVRVCVKAKVSEKST